MPVTEVLAALDAAERDGLIQRDHVQVRPTLRGRRFLNELLQRFLPDAKPRPRAATISISPRDTSRP
jgi:oxygen-independent coproporphyrinogen-3 oxidase